MTTDKTPAQVDCPIHSFAQSYEFRGDDGDHTPTEAERAMIEDAITGYLAAATPQPAAPSQGLVERILPWCDRMDSGGVPDEDWSIVADIRELCAIAATIPAGEVRDREGVEVLLAVLSAVTSEEGCTVFEHNAEEIGEIVMEHHSTIARTLSAVARSQGLAEREWEEAAPENWRDQGYVSAKEATIDMARVGEGLMERIAEVVEHGPMKGWAPADHPAEILIDMANMLSDARALSTPAASVPPGMVLVPREPTKEELKAIDTAYREAMGTAYYYNPSLDGAAFARRAMLSPSPSAPQSEGWRDIASAPDPTPERPIMVWHPEFNVQMATTRYGPTGIGSALKWQYPPAPPALHTPREAGE